MHENAITERLDVLIQLALPTLDPVEKETDESRILSLCDYQHTREQIAKKTGKSLNRVDVVLNGLRKAGKIRSVTKDGQTVYIRLRR